MKISLISFVLILLYNTVVAQVFPETLSGLWEKSNTHLGQNDTLQTEVYDLLSNHLFYHTITYQSDTSTCKLVYKGRLTYEAPMISFVSTSRNRKFCLTWKLPPFRTKTETWLIEHIAKDSLVMTINGQSSVFKRQE